MKTKLKLVVIGNGMAGIRTIEGLLKLTPDLYEICVFGAEPHFNYNRILLTPVLSGEKAVDDILLNRGDWYSENGITLYKGEAVTQINRKSRSILGAKGTCVEYDRVLIATGSSPFIPPIPGAELSGVMSFRDLQDVEKMLEATKRGGRAVVIGGGLLGLEAANALGKQGMEVTVVHNTAYLMDRQLDEPAAVLLQRSLEQTGLTFLMAAQTEAIRGEFKVQTVSLTNGLEIPADLVVIAVGIRPNTELAKSSGLHCERGIVVNDAMQTTDPDIYAVGECIQHRGNLFGLVAPCFEHAKVCANHLAEVRSEEYRGSVSSTRLKVTGVDLFSAGEFKGGEGFDELVFQDSSRGVYKKLVLKDHRICGAVLYGDTGDGSWYFQLMREATDIESFRGSILFGRSDKAEKGPEVQSMESMPDDYEVCGCNGVRKKTIVDAILDKKLCTIDDVRAYTKASSSCGSCTGLVEKILKATLGDYDPTLTEKPICTCTNHTHDAVRQAIAQYRLKCLEALFKKLDWKTPDGCQKCRPALNYYLLCAWPSEYEDDPGSRFINERVHANIQKNGTYSVVPRMWGGLTTPSELRAIADVAEKFHIPTVKVTGGQRIDLLGVRKEDLPGVWADLNAAGMVSGHAYGKSLRTVKTCVGSEWCRFGTQDSTGLGVKLEKMTWGSWTPHKFKMGVSGCPRNCAEATIKDFGIICIDSGYEIHVGGNGGTKIRGTDFLVKVSTEAEVFEYCGAFMQMYREEGHYLERTAPWIERVGLASIKLRLENGDERKHLFEKFKISQERAQVDPWATLAKPDARSKFVAIAHLENHHV